MTDTPLQRSVESLNKGLETTVKASQLLTQFSAVGNNSSANSSHEYKEAKSFRTNSATLVDISTPVYTLNANQAVIQGKTLNKQVFHQQTSCVHNFLRAQETSVLEAQSAYTYTTSEYFVGSPQILTEASRNYMFGDYIKIQSGQSNQQKVSDVDVGDDYGGIGMGAWGDIILASSNKNIFLDSKQQINAIAGDKVRFRSGESMALTAQNGIIINAENEVAVNSNGNMVVSSKNFMAFNCDGTMYLDATIVNIGMGGFWKPSINLETLALSSEVGVQILDGDFSSVIQIPESLSEVSAGFFEGLPQQVLSGNLSSIDSSLFSGLSMSLLGSFTPANVRQVVGGLVNPEEAVGGVFDSLVKSQIPQFGSFVGSAAPSIYGLESAINTFAEGTYTFDTYPRLNQSIGNYNSVEVQPDITYATINGSSFARFPFLTQNS